MPEDFKQKALAWDEKIQKQIEKKPERLTEFVTVSELPVKRVYWPWDVENFDLETDLALPGNMGNLGDSGCAGSNSVLAKPLDEPNRQPAKREPNASAPKPIALSFKKWRRVTK